MSVSSLVRTVYDSPVGVLVIVASDAGLRSVRWAAGPGSGGGGNPGGATAGERAVDPREAADHPLLGATLAQLDEYFAGERREFDLPLDLVGTDFQHTAWAALRAIPCGATATYAQQAERVGRPGAVRALGAANARNPASIVVPCHRVVGAGGTLTGYTAGVEVKRWLLDHEAAMAAADTAGS